MRSYVPRKRKGFDWESLASLVGVLVILGVGGLLAAMFVNQSMLDLLRGPQRTKLQPVSQPEPVAVAGGGGTPSKPPRKPPAVGGEGQPVSPQVPVPASEVDEHLSNAIKSARIGAFDEADLSATKALNVDPKDQRAEGMRFLVAYLRQYSDLADEALANLNHNDTEIDLGGKNGKAAFVDRDGDVLTLRVLGKNKKFTVNDINGMPGARFRITQAFLDRNGNPANDLILGARIFISQQDERGQMNAARSRTLAEQRWRKAAASGDPATVEHANLMLDVLDVK